MTEFDKLVADQMEIDLREAKDQIVELQLELDETKNKLGDVLDLVSDIESSIDDLYQIFKKVDKLR